MPEGLGVCISYMIIYCDEDMGYIILKNRKCNMDQQKEKSWLKKRKYGIRIQRDGLKYVKFLCYENNFMFFMFSVQANCLRFYRKQNKKEKKKFYAKLVHYQ